MPAGSKTPDREALRALTLRARTLVTTIDDAISDLDDVLGEIEEAAGLVDKNGKRYDE